MQRALVIAVLAALLIGACASPPDPVPPPDQEYDAARALRTQIAQSDLAQFARTENQRGDAAFAAGETAYNAGEYEAARAGFNEAIENYTVVVREGFRGQAAARKTAADAQKQRAEAARADVAVPDDYQAALTVYNQANTAVEAGSPADAIPLFENATTLFSVAADRAEEARRRAVNAVGRADARRAQLDAEQQRLEQEALEGEIEAEESLAGPEGDQ
ncbi:MAG: DUF4398 domain-containing protein [Spirochaetaceae bacterium]|nr:MAG: DUF4398 domain-containing protein [Spirochaetaceae bacterium]